MLNGKNTNTDGQLNDFCGIQVSKFFPNTKIRHSIHMEMPKCLGMFLITNLYAHIIILFDLLLNILFIKC